LDAQRASNRTAGNISVPQFHGTVQTAESRESSIIVRPNPEIRQGYVITKAYDISQIRTKPPEPKPIQTLMGALLKDTETKVSIADNLPENVQAQYIPMQRTIFVRNGMSGEVTFHAINRELACAAMDSRDGTYSRAEAVPQVFCAAYVMAEKYGVDCSGFDLDKTSAHCRR